MDDWYALDHVRTLATAAGLTVITNIVEHDGADLTLRPPGRVVPLIDVFVRSWADSERHADHYLIDLPEPAFNRLADTNCTAPQYLFLWRIPTEVSPDLPTDVGNVEHRDLGLFTSLAGQAFIPRPDPRRSRTVRVPLANVLTGRSLRALVASA